MPCHAWRRSVLRWLLAVATLAEFALSGSAVVAQQRPKQVLVLYSTRRDAQIAVVGDRELPRILEAGLTEGLDYYSEFLDPDRFSRPDYQAAFRDFLRSKYQDHRFDLVIAIDDQALELLGAYRREVFPDAPLVFFASTPVTGRISNSTGVIWQLDFSRTLVLALELQPELRQVFFVTGDGSIERRYETMARDQFRPFESRVRATYLTGLPTEELEAQLAALPERSMIYYAVVAQDGAGKNVHPLRYLDRIAEIANAPIYSWVDSALDHGIVGGSLKS